MRLKCNIIGMKIGLLTSHRGQKQYEKEHALIVSHLQKRGHVVLHSFDTTIEKLIPLSYPEREAIFMKFYQDLEDCDLVIAECSVQSTQVGFGLSHLRSKGKPVIILSIKGSAGEFMAKGEAYSNVENMMVCEYTAETLTEVLDDALDFMEPRLDKRFTIIFPSGLLAKLEEKARKQKLPKAVYIRQLIEKDLQENL